MSQPMRKELVRGQTFAAVGVFSYPTAAWIPSVLCDDASVREPSGNYGIDVTMQAIGLTAGSTTHTDYLVTFTASSATTAAWHVKGWSDCLVLLGRMFLTDVLGNVVPTNNRFELKVKL